MECLSGGGGEGSTFFEAREFRGRERNGAHRRNEPPLWLLPDKTIIRVSSTSKASYARLASTLAFLPVGRGVKTKQLGQTWKRWKLETTETLLLQIETSSIRKTRVPTWKFICWNARSILHLVKVLRSLAICYSYIIRLSEGDIINTI